MASDPLADKAKRFWDWFLLNEDRIFQQDPLDDGTVDELKDNLSKMSSHIAVEITSIVEGKRELAFSTMADQELMPVVEALGDAAPEIPRWTIYKYKPRRGLPTARFKDRYIKAENIRYQMIEFRSNLAIILYVEGAEDFDDNDSINFARTILYCVLGELDTLVHVEGYVTRPMSHPGAANAYPLELLADHFDHYVAEKTH